MVDAIWGKVKQELRSRVASRHFDAWIEPARATQWNDGVLTLEVASTFAREWVKRNLADELERTLSAVTGATASVSLLVNRALEDQQTPATGEGESDGMRRAGAQREARLGLPPYTFDGFVVGQSNAMAYRAACTVAAQPGARFNPLFIHGHVGLGKTHLLAATAHALQEAGRRVRYVSGEAFVNEMIEALRRDRMETFRRRYRGIETLIVDDVQFLADKERSQAEFTHTFNALHQSGKQIVLASDRSPEEMQGVGIALRNRLAAGLTVDVRPPDAQLRRALVERKVAASGVAVGDGVTELLCDHWWENVRELEGIITRVAAFAAVTSREVTRMLVEEALGIVARRPPRRVTVQAIKAMVCEEFGVTREELESAGRTARVCNSRQVAMYLCRQHTDSTLARIGDAFGGRDHTTVAHALGAIERRLREDERLRTTVRTLQERISSSR